MLLRSFLAAGTLACLAAAPLVVHAAEVRTVALSAVQAPGLHSGVLLRGLEMLPRLNMAGQTAFRVTLSGSEVDSGNNHSIWLESSGALNLVVRSGNHAPGSPEGVNFSTFSHFQLNDVGHVAFFANIVGDGVENTNNRGIWSDASGRLALIARSGAQAPGMLLGVNFKGLGSPQLAGTGQVAFLASLIGEGVDSSNNFGIWLESNGIVNMVWRTGVQAKGTPTGVNYRGLIGSPLINNAGQVAFLGYVEGSGVHASSNQGIWAERSGSLELVALSGNQAPGTPDGVNFRSFGLLPPLSDNRPAFNDAGQTAFLATLSGSGVGSTNNQGIWSERSGSLQLVARSGAHAPDTFSGVNFESFHRPEFNVAGQTAFLAALSGNGVNIANNQGLWLEGSSGLRLLARSASQVPGAPDGVHFERFTPPELNEAGQIAFFAIITGNGVDASNNEGIWATDRTGTLRLIVRKGDLLRLTSGELHTVASLRVPSLIHNANPPSSGFNDLGQLAFWASFSNRTNGIVVSNLVAVPEPSTLLIIALFAAAMAVRRRFA